MICLFAILCCPIWSNTSHHGTYQQHTDLCDVLFVRHDAHTRWWFIVYTHYIPGKKKISKFGPHGLTKKFYIYMMSCKNSFFFLAKRGLRQNEASTNTEYHVFTYIRFVSMTTFNTLHINVTIHLVLKYSNIKHASRCLIHKTIPCNSENSLEGVSLKQARKGKQ